MLKHSPLTRTFPVALVALGLFALLISPAVIAGGDRAYSPEALSKAQAQGKVVVLDFHASWCPTCRKQASVLSELAGDAKLKNKVAFLRVDFDDADALRDKMKVSKQSTLVVLKGGKEIARATGITSREGIRDLIAKAL